MRSIVLLFACLAVSVVHAAAPPVESPQTAYQRLWDEAFSHRVVRTEYGPRFAAHADRYPDHPSAIEALLQAVAFSYPDSETRKGSLRRLEKHYARSPLVESHLRNLGMSSDGDRTNFLRQIGNTNPDLRLRALAWRAMINGRSGNIRSFQRLVDGKKFRGDYLKKAEADLATWRKDVDEAREHLKSAPLAGVLADVSVGAKAPPTEAVDLAGKKVSLGDHKGKVVVLDFWFTECGPCLRMVPGANALIAELKGKSFVQVGVSVDPDRNMVRAFLEKKEMPWTHWWVGYGSKPLETWDVEAYPTVYVIDHEGVIRHHQVGSNELDNLYALVRELVKKAEAARK